MWEFGNGLPNYKIQMVYWYLRLLQVIIWIGYLTIMI